MARSLNIFPYYSTHLDQAAKKYKNVLFVPGKAPQARELTETQTLLHEQHTLNWNSMFKNGSVTDGCNLAIALNDPYGAATANLPEGKFYFEGRVLEVEAQELEILGVGTENIGFYIEETFVTYSEDPTLTDPASGYSNYNLDGAHRLMIEVKLVKIVDVPVGTRPTLPATSKYADEENVVTIWNLIDGVVQNFLRKPGYSLLADVMAKRTYDESGNYLVEGMRLKAEASTTTGKIKVAVTPGICYVKGYDNTYIVPRTIEVDKALTTEQYTLEPHAFDAYEVSYQLFHPFVVIDPTVELITVTAVVAETVSITRGSGDYDTFEDPYGLVFSSIESIVSIPGYIETTDYVLAADQIHWVGNRPSIRTDYTVSFRYYKNAVRDTDFKIEADPTETDGNVYQITWGLGGDDPAVGTNVLVNYSVYKARTDLFAIDKFGKIVVKTGTPTLYSKTVIPPYNEELLPLGWIKFMPGLDYGSAIIYEYRYERTTMFELHQLKKRVDDLEENVAALALEGEAKEGELATTLKGILVDPFNTFYKADATHTDFYASMNLMDGELYIVSLNLAFGLERDSDTETNITKYADKEGYDKLITLKWLSDTAFFENILKTDLMNLNPHGYIKNLPYATMNPAIDEWIDETVTEVTVIEDEIIRTTINNHQLQWVSAPTNDTVLQKESRNQIGSNISQGNASVKDRLVTYARQKWVDIKGYSFEPAGILGATFGGQAVTLIAESPYMQGTGVNAAKIIIAADGSWHAKFYIPAGVECGNIQLKLTDEYDNEISVIYKAKGINRVIENKTIITKTYEQTIDVFEILKAQVATGVVDESGDGGSGGGAARIGKEWQAESGDVTHDPLAQSFIFAADHLLTALGFYFGTKADAEAKPMVQDDYYNYNAFAPELPAILTIGYMVNGLPDSKNIIHMQEIYPSEITTSLYGTVETKITLQKPVFIPAMQEFYISIGSKSTEYTVFVAKLGQTDLDSGSVVMKQAYQDGVLFTSSNGLTWSPAQDLDMTIKLYEGNFETSGSFITEEIAAPITDPDPAKPAWAGFGRFIFKNTFSEMPYSQIEYFYSLDSGTTWTVFNPGDEIDTGAASTKIQFKGVLTGNGKTTPMVNIDTALVFFKYDVSQTGQYRTKVVEDAPAYNNMKIILDEYLASGTNIIKEFSPLADTTLWFRLVHDAIESTDLENGFYRKTYEFNLDLLQRLTVTDETGFAVGDDVSPDPYSATTAKIVAIDTLNNYVYVMLNSDAVARFTVSDTLESNTTSTAISVVYDYTSEPTWFTNFTGRLLLESTSYWKSPVAMNYRMIARAK